MSVGRFGRPLLNHRLEVRTTPWRVEVRPLASGHLERAHNLLVHSRNEAERMRLRRGRYDFSCPGFEALQTAGHASDQFSPSDPLRALLIQIEP